MDNFRQRLQREFVRRTSRNPNYSLRAYANYLRIHHATLSTLMSGKRKITRSTATKLCKALGLTPAETERYCGEQQTGYVDLRDEAFASISEWYYDAILVLSEIDGFVVKPKEIARALEISPLQAKLALETLLRLKLLEKTGEGSLKPTHVNTTNLLAADYTSTANRKHQQDLLNKSIAAIDAIPRDQRDHTSMVFAMDKNDLPEIKKLIARFRRELDKFAGRPGARREEVFQLQVSLFPLSRINQKRGSDDEGF